MAAANAAAKRMERKENIFLNKRMWFCVTDISRETTNVLLEMLNEKIRGPQTPNHSESESRGGSRLNKKISPHLKCQVILLRLFLPIYKPVGIALFLVGN